MNYKLVKINKINILQISINKTITCNNIFKQSTGFHINEKNIDDCIISVNKNTTVYTAILQYW